MLKTTTCWYDTAGPTRVLPGHQHHEPAEGEVGHLGPHTDIRGEEHHQISLSLHCQGLFAAANIFSSLKLVYIFSVNPYLGPLQVSTHFTVIDQQISSLSSLLSPLQ